jgi:hypothetical protein
LRVAHRRGYQGIAQGSETRVSRKGRQRGQVVFTWCVFPTARSLVLRGCYAHDGFRTDWMCIALPTSFGMGVNPR